MSEDVGFRFVDYTETELRTCGKRFLKDCTATWQMHGATRWTEYVLNWFSNTVPREETRVDARRGRGRTKNARATRGEWMLDLVHTSYPATPTAGYWKREIATEDDPAWEILLALESEWGKVGAHGYTFEMVLEDASKLTAVRAAVKVLVSSATKGHGDDATHGLTLEKAIVTLRRRTRDTAPWLWINLPNEETPANCRYMVFGDQ